MPASASDTLGTILVRMCAILRQAYAAAVRRAAGIIAVAWHGVIDPRDTRTVVGLCLSAIHSGPVTGTRFDGAGFGVFRM